MEKIENVIFDLGGVLFERDKTKYTPEFYEFFSFIRNEQLPLFWNEYDQGKRTLEEVTRILAQHKGVSFETANAFVQQSITAQQTVASTEALVGELKKAGYKLYVLSNMAREFIDFLHTFAVYGLFDGEVVSCEEGVSKPDARIYEILLSRYGLDPAHTLFTDDRPSNLRGAEKLGIQTLPFDYDHPERTCEALKMRLL